MDKKYFLMLKTHKITGLKYLCFHHGTDISCFTYRGSGKYWTNHIRKHGNYIDTVILLESDDKDDITKEGIRYSTLWDIVKSKEFANLTIEDAQTTAEPLQRKESRLKRKLSIEKRISEIGLTPKEIEAKKKAIAIMHSPKNREKAYASIRNRYTSGNLTDKQLQRGENTKQRILNFGFTEKEKARGGNTSKRQTGKTMQERLNNPNYIDPRKGKTFNEIYGDNYIHPKKGKKRKDVLQGCKPFKFIVNGNVEGYYKSEDDFEIKSKLSRLMVSKIKKKNSHIIKRQSNTKHKFNNGDIVEVIPITIEEYKQFVR